MRKLFTILILGFTFNIAFPQEIGYDEAKEIATEFFKSSIGSGVILSSTIVSVDSFATFFIKKSGITKSATSEGIPAFYIFNRSDQPGFALVSGDRRVRTIIAYSIFKNLIHINPGLQTLLNQYIKEIAFIKESSIVESTSDYNVTQYTPGTWLLDDIEWNQDCFYNKQCPSDDRGPCNQVYAGCVATAMAQIMKYWNYPATNNPIPGYTDGINFDSNSNSIPNSDYGLIPGRPINTYTWTNMPDKLTWMSSSDKVDAVSQLIYDCGVAVEMNYGPIGSGAYDFDAFNAFKNYFKYSSNCEYMSKSSYTWSEWYSLIQTELENERPIYYRATDPDDPDDPNDRSGGHAFIIDGYKEDGTFHINWGWGGDENTFYPLTLLNTDEFDFSDEHRMIINIEPDLIPPQLSSFSQTTDIATNIVITFNEFINESTLNSSNIIVQGTISGLNPFSSTYDPYTRTYTIDPEYSFYFNESVDVILTTGITDLAGNSLDGDKNGTPGPNCIFSFTTGGYNHDYAINSMALSKPNPFVGDNIIVSGIVKNEGLSSEPPNQVVYLFDNEVQQPGYFMIPSALTPGQEYNVQMNWTAKEGPHNLKLRVLLSGDENSSNNEKSISVYPGTEGTLLIDGATNSTVNLTLSPGNSVDGILQLGNIGTASINASVTKGGEIANWILLTQGTSISIPKVSNIDYTYKISVPSNITAYRTYSGYITFTYENNKSATVQFSIQVVPYVPGYFRNTLSSSSVLIDGAVNNQEIILQNVEYLDNDPATTHPTHFYNTYSFDPTVYNRINYAHWILTAREDKGTAILRPSIPEGSGYKEYSSSISGVNNDILGWLVTGQNTFNLGFKTLVIDAATVSWYVGYGNSSINLQYSKAGWGASCPISPINTIKDGLDYCRIYFTVDDVQTPGGLILCNGGIGSIAATKSVSASDEGDELYFTLTSSKFNESNYFSIKGNPDNDTKVYISNIRIEIKYFTGEPNLICTKSLSKNTANINEDITVNLSFNNIGDNIADEPRYDDNPLPTGLLLTSGSLSGDPDDVRPGVPNTASYVIRPQIPGIYTFGGTTVTYQDFANNDYSTKFNTVSLTVNGGNLLVSGNTDKTNYNKGEMINISAQVIENINNSPIQDAKVTCQVKNTDTNTIIETFFLLFDQISGSYINSFNSSSVLGNYEIVISAEKDFYSSGNLVTPLVFTITGPPYLNIDPQSYTVTSEAGSRIFTVSSNILWNVSEDYDWLNVLVIDANHFQVIYDATTSVDYRNAVIRVTSNELSERIAIISQAGIPQTLPVLSTIPVSNIAVTSAISGGIVVSDGGANVIARGVCWSTSPNPTVDLSTKTSDGTGIGAFTSSITGLTAGTTYHVRAYATISAGTGYGDDVTLTTLKVYQLEYITGNNQTYSGGGMPLPMVFKIKNITDNVYVTNLVAENLSLNATASIGYQDAAFNNLNNYCGNGDNSCYGGYYYIEPNSGSAFTLVITVALKCSSQVVSEYLITENITQAPSLPSVSTNSVSGITRSSAISGGEVISQGPTAITVRGVCWSTSTGPTVNLATKTSDGTGTGTFTSTVNGLLAGTTYYLRAYATNSSGTAYGNEVSFKTYNSDAIQDIDGNYYDIVTIGTQVWIMENLKTTKFSDNTSIPIVTDYNVWGGLSTPGFCWYNNDEAANKYIYGALYNFYAINTAKLCPAGWHVPTEVEWTTLEQYLVTNAGGKLKETGITHWVDPNSGATNETGFTALPGGYRYVTGYSFYDIGIQGHFWSSSVYDPVNKFAVNRQLSYDNTELLWNYTYFGSGMSVRCLKDNIPSGAHFVPAWSGSGMDHMNLYALTAKLDNIDLQPGDEIGIFDGNVCVGMGTLTQVLTGSTYLSMVVSKDDPDTPAKDGYTPDNTISFKVWDSSAGKEFSDAQADYVSGSGIFSVGGTSTFNLNAITSITQDISLTAGWNIMSFAGEPDNLSLSSIVNSLKVAGTLVKIQDERGSAIEQLPSPIGWVDNIGLMKVSEGYKIKVSANTTLSVTGKPVTLPYTIDLSNGWNIMGYPSMSSQAAMAAFQSLINSGTFKVQDEKGNAIEQLPAPIGWVDNIHTLAPGEGYKIKVSSATSITINNSGKGEYENTEFVTLLKPSHFKPAYTGNGFDHMNIYLKEVTIGGAGLQPGDEIGVFDGGVCVGAVVVEDPDSEYIMVTASFDDPTTKETDGFLAGHNFTLKLWDRQTGVESNTKDEQYEKGSGNLFERLGTSVLMADFEPMSNISFGYAYPNPSTEKTTFTFEVAGETDVRLEIFNMRGDLIKVLVDRKMPGGVHLIEWDNRLANGTSANSGIYFYRLRFNNFSQTKQLVIH